MKQYKEVIKTIVITSLIVGIGAFIAGVRYEQTNTKRIESAAKSLQVIAPASVAAAPTEVK